jgi:hypothetical protein
VWPNRRRISPGTSSAANRAAQVVKSAAAELVELSEDHHQGVIGGLDRQVVEVAAGGVRELGGPPANLVSGFAEQQRVQPANCRLAYRALGVQLHQPRARDRVERARPGWRQIGVDHQGCERGLEQGPSAASMRMPGGSACMVLA